MNKITRNFYQAKAKAEVYRWFTTLCLTAVLCLGVVMQANATTYTVSATNTWTGAGLPSTINAGDIVNVTAGTLTLNADVVFNGTMNNTGGTIVAAGGAAKTLAFGSGSIFNINGSTITNNGLPTGNGVTWDANSEIVLVDMNYGSSNYVFNETGKTYGKFTVNMSTASAKTAYFISKNALAVTFAGAFTITTLGTNTSSAFKFFEGGVTQTVNFNGGFYDNTGTTGSLNWANTAGSTVLTLNCAGDFIVTNAKSWSSFGAGSISCALNLTGVNKTFTPSTQFQSFTVNIASGASYTLGRNIASAGTSSPYWKMTVNGSLDCGAYTITGVGSGGSFALASGATIKTSLSGGLPAVVLTFPTKTFTAGANYVFNGATTTPFGALTIGNPNNLDINANVTLPATTTTGTITVGSSATLTLGGNVTCTTFIKNGALNCVTYTLLASGVNQCNLTTPTLTAAVGATVDAPFDVTFTDDAAWRSAITSITVGGTTLTAGYAITAGKITFTPSASVPAGLLQTSGTKNIVVIASGYSNATVSQTIAAGAGAKLAITTQPTAPAANGAVLATQPVVIIQDQYNNTTTSTATVAAAVGAGTWILGGTTSVAGVAGTVTYSGLTATSTVAVTGATITFTSTGLTSVTSNGFNIPGPTGPTLTAAVGATVDAPFDVTFTDDAAWRSAITSITVGGTALTAGYAITAGKITFTPSASVPAGLLQTSGTKNIVVIATGYSNTTVSQTIAAGTAAKLAIATQPTAPVANGGVLATQPVVIIQDQYGNATTSTATVAAAVGAGTWTLGGTTSVAGVAGTATYSGLTAGSAAAVTGATITFTSAGLTSATSGTFNIPAPAAPTLTADATATVDDASIDITFPADAAWEGAITNVQVGGIDLAAGAWSIASGVLHLVPANDTKLQTIGNKNITVIATNYANGTVTQSIAAGALTHMMITTQPTAPATNGGVLAAQPIVALKDQYNNTTNSTQAVTVAANAGTWNLGGTLTVNAVNGVATFSGLTAGTTDGSFLNGAYLVVSSAGVANLNSNTYNIPADDLATDYFRSIMTGDWNVAGTWEISHNGTSGWRISTIIPGASATMTTIQDGHTVTVSANTTIGNTTVNSGTTGGTLKTTTTAVVTVSSGKTLTVNGTFENNGTVTDLVSTGATVLFNANSTYLLSGASPFFPGGATVTWDANSTINVTVGPASGNLTNTASTVYGNIIFNTNAPTGTIVPFTNASQRIAGNLTITQFGTGILQLISSGGTNILPIDGNYLQSAGIVLMNPSSQAATTFRPVVVKGNFTLDGGTFRLSSSTANCYLIVKGNFTVNNSAVIENTGATNASGAAYVHLAGNGAQTYSRSATSAITATVGNKINFVVNSGTVLDMGTSIIDGSANVNVTVSGAYTASALTGTTTASSNLITITAGSMSGILPGMAISGGSIPANTYVTAVYSGTQLQLSKQTTAAATGVSITIASASAATIKTANVGGLDAAFANGGTKTLHAAANYEFNGVAAQVTGVLLTSANNVTINNATGVSLSAGTTVSGNLTLTSGNLTLGSNNLTLSAAVAGTPSATKHIVTDGTGAVIATCTAGNGYTFPVGYSTSTYNQVTITNNSAGSLTYSVLAKATAPALAGSLSAMWDITGATANSTFVFPWGAESVAGTPAVYQYDGSSAWNIISGATTASSTTTLTNATSNNVGKYWTVATANSTTWNGSAWSYGVPTTTIEAIITGSFDTSVSTGTEFTAKKLTVNSGGSLTIKTGTSITVQNEVINNAGANGIVVEDTGSLVQVNDAAVNTGNIKYNRNTTAISNMDYTYWASPVTNFTLGGVSPNTVSDKFYSFDSSIEDWKQESAATVMTPGVGYIIRGPQTATYMFPNPPSLYQAAFTGVPNNGHYQITGILADKSYLLGNPYPSALDADTFIDANQTVLDGTLYFWTHNTPIGTGVTNPGSGTYAYSSDDYASYNRTGGAGTAAAPSGSPNNSIPSGKIASGQGFFASSVVAPIGTTIDYYNNMRVGVGGITGNNSQFFKTKNPNAKKSSSVEKHRVWLDLTNDQGAFKQTLIGYITGATNEYDNGFDGVSFNANQFVDFYSVNQNKRLVIQGRALPFDENDEIPLGYKTSIDGPLTISIDQTDGLLVNQEVFLEDKLTNTVTNLKTGSYTFTTAQGRFNDRFVLRYTDKTLGVNVNDLPVDDNSVKVYKNNGVLTINAGNVVMANIKVFDIQGRLLVEQKNVDTTITTIKELKETKQVLIVKVTSQDGKVVTKKVMN